MALWLLRRVGQVIPTLIILSILIFGLQQLMPGDPAVILAGEERGDEQVLAQIRAELGLDKPIWQQYLLWIGRVLTGDFGFSWRIRVPVSELILTKLPVTFQLASMAFVIAILIGVPLGIVSGLSPTATAAINPLVQVFKPVSPLAWLPIVTMVVSAVYAGGEGAMSKSFLISAITVTLCSLWPTLINTALGVASIDKDLVNVGKVLKLGPWTKITKLVLPSALPLIFTGLRLSLGVGWMVLIAAEMLAQNPGLGKFVWDEFQNGSSDSLARIMVAVLTIGIIGFLLDRLMFAIQSLITFSDKR